MPKWTAKTMLEIDPPGVSLRFTRGQSLPKLGQSTGSRVQDSEVFVLPSEAAPLSSSV